MLRQTHLGNVMEMAASSGIRMAAGRQGCRAAMAMPLKDGKAFHLLLPPTASGAINVCTLLQLCKGRWRWKAGKIMRKSEGKQEAGGPKRDVRLTEHRSPCSLSLTFAWQSSGDTFTPPPPSCWIFPLLWFWIAHLLNKCSQLCFSTFFRFFRLPSC